MAKQPVPRCALLQRTIELLRTRGKLLTLQLVSKDTGLHHRWLESLLLPNNNSSPSVCAIVTLYEYLSETKLTIK